MITPGKDVEPFRFPLSMISGKSPHSFLPLYNGVIYFLCYQIYVYIYIFKIEIVEEGSGATKGCVKNRKLLRKIVR